MDYFTEAEHGKKQSGQDNWELNLNPGKKHIEELASLVGGSIRIGFKLESNVEVDTLIQRAEEQIKRYGVYAVVANLMEEMYEPRKLRARIVHDDGRIVEIEDDFSLVRAIEGIISPN